MPIIGLTDRGAAFPQIGTLRKGGEKTDPKRPGPDLDYFRFDADDEQAATEFAAAYGDRPRAIRIYLPFDGTDDNLVAWNEHWVAGGLVRRCDGQTCVLQQRPGGKGYDQTPRPCVCQTFPPDSKERCKPVGRLKVIIPELKRLAYVVALTTSIHDIKNLSEQLRALEAMRGSLRGIPMILSRIEREISMPGSDGKRVRRSKWLLAIEAAPHWVSLQLQAQERAALPEPAPVARPALMAPAYDDDDEPAADPRPALPPAPPVDEHGEVIADEPAALVAAGTVSGVQMRYNAQGEGWLTFAVEGAGPGRDDIVITAKIVEGLAALAYLEDGDVVRATYEPRTNRGKTVNLLTAIEGERNADGMTDWEERAAQAEAEGATFDPHAYPADPAAPKAA